MSLGPGKYDAQCTQARVLTNADGAILLIINGNKGSGFSCQCDLPTTVKLPAILRSMADQIGADTKGGTIRAQLIDVLIHHAQTSTSGCACGGVKLGGSYPEHIADVLKKRLQ
jgi:hypothetical protein